MKKYFLIALLCSCCFQTFSQNVDSLRIDSLKNQLPHLKGISRIDCLNDITDEYRFNKRKADSVDKYARLAYQEASKIGYKKGLAFSLFNLKGTKEERAKYIQLAKQIGEELNNDSILGWYYYLHGDSKLSQTENFKKSAAYFQKAGDEEDEAEIVTWLAPMLMYEGKYEEAFPYAERSVILVKKKRTHGISLGPVLIQFSFKNISELYKVVGDYETALEYLQKARRYSIENHQEWNMDSELGVLFNKAGQYDSAIYYLQKNLEANPLKPDAKILLAKTYLLVKNYDKSITLFKQATDSIRKPRENQRLFHVQRNNSLLMTALLSTAKAYSEKKNHKAALKYVKESNKYRYGDTILVSSAESLMHDYDLLSTIYHNIHKDDSAYKYLKKYVALKDSLDNKKTMWRLNMKLSNYKSAAINAKKEADIALLAKDNKIKEQQLKQQGLIKKFLIAGLILFSLIGIFIFRTLILKRKNEKLLREHIENEMKVQQLENEKKHADLRQQATELEMQALRAQMNPHFIFNCLSSINRFILKNESKAASNYLTRFSRLIRMVLINSQKPLIALEDELQMLRLYLDMERLRFKDSFDYSITFLNTMDGDNIFIPPLLLQPFCENAIWHGLMNLPAGRQGKEGQGSLDIELSMQDNILNCTITDNGIGREKAEEMKSKSAEKKKSMGLKITTERLALLNREKGVNTFYEIEDLLDENGNAAGTKVNLKISYKESVEELG